MAKKRVIHREHYAWCNTWSCVRRVDRIRERRLIRRLGYAQGIAYRMLARRGAVGQFGCLVALWGRESGWNATAHNSSSGAHGIPQALPGSKMGPGWWGDARVQVAWGISYIFGRYGSPCAADAFQRSHNWY